MLYAIPVVGWILGFIFSLFIAIPFYFVWNSMAPIYFYWLPDVYHEIPFWDCVFLFMLTSMVRVLVLGSYLRVGSYFHDLTENVKSIKRRLKRKRKKALRVEEKVGE